MKASVLVIVLLLSACGGSPEDPVAESREAGRQETQLIRNTESIGYSGDAIGGKVDGALNANDDRRRQLDEAENAQY